MKRSFAIFAFVLLIPISVAAQDKKEEYPYIGPVKMADGKKFYSLKVGDIGHVGKHVYTVAKIYLAEGGDRDFAIFSIDTFRFIVGGVSLKGLADRDPVELSGVWEVQQPTLSSGRRYPTLRPCVEVLTKDKASIKAK